MSKPFLTSKEYESLAVELRTVVDGLLTLYAYLRYRIENEVIQEKEHDRRKEESKRARLGPERRITDLEQRVEELEKRIKKLEKR